LGQAQEQFSRRERELAGKAPPWPEPVACRHFVADMVPLVLDLGGSPAPVRLVVAESVEEIQEGIRRSTRGVMLWSLVPVVLISSFLALGLAYYVTRPLVRIVTAAERLGAGDYAVEIPDHGPREV